MAFGPLSLAERDAVRRYCGYGQGYPHVTVGDVPWAYFDYPGLIDKKLGALDTTMINTVRQMLTYLYALEAALYAPSGGISDNLTVDTADVFKRNKNELPERMRLYTSQRLELCRYMQLNPGPQFPSSGGFGTIW